MATGKLYKYLCQALNCLFENELKNKNYYVFSLLYRKLGLFDNKRLVEKFYDHKKMFGDITSSIYADMADIFIDELLVVNNKEFINAFENYYNEKFPFLNQRLNKIVKHNEVISIEYLNSKLLYDVDINKDTIKWTYGKYFVGTRLSMLPSYSDSFISNEVYSQEIESLSAIEKLQLEWGIEDLSNNRIITRYVENRLKELCSYIGISLDDFPSFVERLPFFSNNRFTDEYNKGILDYYEMEGHFLHIFDKYKLSDYCFSSLNVNVSKIFTDLFEKQCFNMVYYAYLNMSTLENKELKISMINKFVKIENPEAFWKQLIFSFFSELLFIMNNILLKGYYNNFTFDKVVKTDSFQTMQNEIDLLHKLVLSKDKALEELKECNLQSLNKMQSQMQNIAHPYIQEINSLNKDIEQLNQTCFTLNQKISDQEKLISLLENSNDDIVYFKYDEHIFNNKKFLFIGGRTETILELQKQFPEALFTSSINETLDINGVEYLIIFYKFMSHALFYKYIDLARNSNTQVIYCAGSNIEIILQKMAAEIKE